MPPWQAGSGGRDRLPLFDDLRVCLAYDFAHFRERLPAPVPKFLDLLVDIVSSVFTFMYFRSSTRRRFPLQFDLIVINGGTDEIF